MTDPKHTVAVSMLTSRLREINDLRKQIADAAQRGLNGIGELTLQYERSQSDLKGLVRMMNHFVGSTVGAVLLREAEEAAK